MGWFYLVKGWGHCRDFSDAAVAKNPSANSGDTGLIPGPEGFHIPQSNEARGSQLLSPRALQPVLCDKRSPSTTRKNSPGSLQLEKAQAQQ